MYILHKMNIFFFLTLFDSIVVFSILMEAEAIYEMDVFIAF